MHSSSPKGSTHVDVFSAQGRDPASRWQLSGPVRREYSKQLKGYTYVMEGDSSTTRMRLPKSDKGTCEFGMICAVRIAHLSQPLT